MSESVQLSKAEPERNRFEDITIRVRDFAKSFVDTIREPFLLLDNDKKVIYVNRSFCETFKVTVDETIGNVLYDIGKREWDIPKLRTLFDEILQKEKDFNGFEVEHNFPTIGHKIMMLNARIIEAEGRSDQIILLAIEDITDIRKKENELKEYEAHYGRYFETAHDGLLLIDYNNGRIVNSNPAITSMLGYSVEDFKGKSLNEVGLIDEAEFRNVISNLKDFGFVYFDYFLAKTKEGKTIDTEIYLVDRTKFIQCNVRYITERIRVKEFAKSFVDTIREPFLLLDNDKKVIYVNRSFCDTFKVTVDETIGNVLYDIGKREWDIPKLRTLFDEILQKEKDFNGFEVEHNFPTIGHKIMLLNARIIEAEGRPEHIILLAIEDITDIRKKENELKEYEARYRRYFETAHDGLLLIEYYNGRIVNSNPAITSMLGYSAEDLKGKSLQEVGLIDEVEFQNVLPNLKDFGFVYFDHFLAKTKEEKTMDTEIYLVDRTKFIQCNVRDITERKKTENELRIYHENLAETVKERTKQLDAKIHDLEAFNKVFVGRELRMIELKKIIDECEKEVTYLKKSVL